MKKLLSPLVTGTLRLENRVVMAPMNRRRAIDGIPGKNAIEYFGQRAGAGLIITDNVGVAHNGFGYPLTPGIYNDAQKQGWKKVADTVHAKGGKIFMQLVHTGRIGHPLNHEGLAPVVAPSAVAAAGTIRTPEGHLPMPVPEVLDKAGIHVLIEAHVQAAKSAIEIGFDGVEIHGRMVF